MNHCAAIHDFEQILTNCFVSVLSQSSGKQWDETVAADGSGDAAISSSMFHLAVSLTGSVRLECALADTLVIGNILLGTGDNDTGAESLLEEQKEAVEEFFRQVMGLAETALGARFGKVTIEPAAVDGTPLFQQLMVVTATQETQRASIAISVDSSLYERLSPPAKDLHTGIQAPGNLDLLMDVELPVMMRFGERQMKLRDILELGSGAVVELNRKENEPVELLLDGKLIARGEVVVVEGNYGFRVVEVAASADRLQAVPR